MKKHKGLRAMLALLFASFLGMSMLACEENDGLGDAIEDAGDEIEEGLEDATD